MSRCWQFPQRQPLTDERSIKQSMLSVPWSRNRTVAGGRWSPPATNPIGLPSARPPRDSIGPTGLPVSSYSPQEGCQGWAASVRHQTGRVVLGTLQFRSQEQHGGDHLGRTEQADERDETKVRSGQDLPLLQAADLIHFVRYGRRFEVTVKPLTDKSRTLFAQAAEKGSTTILMLLKRSDSPIPCTRPSIPFVWSERFPPAWPPRSCSCATNCRIWVLLASVNC